jgi:integrase
MPLGKYPDVSLAAARIAHNDARKELAKGNDPMAKRKADKAAIKAKATLEKTIDERSFKAVALKWHEFYMPGVGSDTAAYILRRLEADVFPAFGNKLIDEVKASDVRELIKAIEMGKGQGRRFPGTGARDVAQRQHGTISKIYRYAIAHELADYNPAAAFEPGDVLSPRTTKHRARVKLEELPSLLAAMENYDGHMVVKLALKLMALTFVRTEELLGAPWTEFDFESALWRVDADRMKKGRTHLVPLSRQAVTILQQLKQMAGAKRYVFPGLNSQTEDGSINSNSLLNALDDLGYKGIMTGHGYRGLARTVLAEIVLTKHTLNCSSHTQTMTRPTLHTTPLYI